jgi:hypothetical protein
LRVNQVSTLIILFEKFLNKKWRKFGSLLGTKNWQTKEKVKKQKDVERMGSYARGRV